MVIDSSALVAIVLEEPEESMYYSAIANSLTRLLSTATLVEASLVLIRRSTSDSVAALDELITRLKIEVVSFTEQQSHLAREAYRRFGKGRHRAGLNFGDCFAYALAQETGEPLLFKGDDFTHTDLVRA